MDITRLKDLAGIVAIEKKEKSEIVKEFYDLKLNETVDFIRHVKVYGAQVDIDDNTNIAKITINESTKQLSEDLFSKIIREWKYGEDTILESEQLWGLYIAEPGSDEYGLQFSDTSRSSVVDEWKDSWKDQYDDNNKKIKYKYKIVKIDSENPKKTLSESATQLNEFETIYDVVKAVEDGKKVVWKSEDYVVGKDLYGDYNVTYKPWSRKPDTVLLFHKDGKSTDYKPEDFWINEAYTVLPAVDSDRYIERAGLEGPFRWRNGRVVYYDPKEGKYYDPDTDMFIEYDEYIRANNPDIRESVNINEATFDTIELQLPAHWASALINADTTGLDDEEEAALDRWVDWASDEYNIRAGQPLGVTGEEEFKRYHDADDFVGATDVLTFVYRVEDSVTESKLTFRKNGQPDLGKGQPKEKRIETLKNNIEDFKEKNRTLPKDNHLRQDQEKQIERWSKELDSLLNEDHGGGYYVCYGNNKEHHKTEAEATAAKIKLEKSGVTDVTVKKDTEAGAKEALNKANKELKEENDIHTKLHDSDKNSKIKVPNDVKQEAKKQIKDIEKSITEFDKAAKTDNSTKNKTIDSINHVLEILDGGTLEDLKKAQVYYSTLMNPITNLFPNLLVKFLADPKNFIKL